MKMMNKLKILHIHLLGLENSQGFEFEGINADLLQLLIDAAEEVNLDAEFKKYSSLRESSQIKKAVALLQPAMAEIYEQSFLDAMARMFKSKKGVLEIDYLLPAQVEDDLKSSKELAKAISSVLQKLMPCKELDDIFDQYDPTAV